MYLFKKERYFSVNEGTFTVISEAKNLHKAILITNKGKEKTINVSGSIEKAIKTAKRQIKNIK